MEPKKTWQHMDLKEHNMGHFLKLEAKVCIWNDY